MRQCGYLDSTDSRTSGLERLRLQYDSDGLVLFLGAGVSKASGIPEWRELIDLMLKTLRFGPTPENASSVSRLLEEKASLSLLSQFDLVSQQCEDSNQPGGFVGILRAHLYGAREFQEIRRLMNAIPVAGRRPATANDSGPGERRGSPRDDIDLSSSRLA